MRLSCQLSANTRRRIGACARELKVFVSYSRKDKDFVVWFSDALQAQDVNVLRDLDDILPTEEWWPRIEKLITAADTVVFVVSPNSVSSEIARARSPCARN